MRVVGWKPWAAMAVIAIAFTQSEAAGLALLVIGVGYLVINHIDERHEEIISKINDR